MVNPQVTQLYYLAKPVSICLTFIMFCYYVATGIRTIHFSKYDISGVDEWEIIIRKNKELNKKKKNSLFKIFLFFNLIKKRWKRRGLKTYIMDIVNKFMKGYLQTMLFGVEERPKVYVFFLFFFYLKKTINFFKVD